jgi:hypothetical protein
VAAVALVLLTLLSAQSCARTLSRPLQQPSPTAITQLWQSPTDLESRDLFHGPGGNRLLPRTDTFTFVAHKTTGTNKVALARGLLEDAPTTARAVDAVSRSGAR